jgi:hypothetical protein
MQICASFPTQKTSRQQEVMPRLGGRFFKVCVVWDVNGEVFWIWDCDCKRTRTTSKGVTKDVNVESSNRGALTHLVIQSKYCRRSQISSADTE